MFYWRSKLYQLFIIRDDANDRTSTVVCEVDPIRGTIILRRYADILAEFRSELNNNAAFSRPDTAAGA